MSEIRWFRFDRLNLSLHRCKYVFDKYDASSTDTNTTASVFILDTFREIYIETVLKKALDLSPPLLVTIMNSSSVGSSIEFCVSKFSV